MKNVIDSIKNEFVIADTIIKDNQYDPQIVVSVLEELEDHIIEHIQKAAQKANQ